MDIGLAPKASAHHFLVKQHTLACVATLAFIQQSIASVQRALSVAETLCGRTVAITSSCIDVASMKIQNALYAKRLTCTETCTGHVLLIIPTPSTPPYNMVGMDA